MSRTPVGIAYGTSAQIAAMTPAANELILNIDNGNIHIGDGLTAGGKWFIPSRLISASPIFTDQRLSASSISLTTNSPANINTLTSLPAGIYDVSANIVFDIAATTVVDYVATWTSVTSATLPTPPNNGAYIQNQGFTMNNANSRTLAITIGTQRITLASVGNIYMSTQCGFTISTLKGFGFISARRVWQ